MITPTKRKAKRTSLYLGPHLREFLESGRVRGKSDSDRMDRLARRYAFLLQEAAPKRFMITPPELQVLASFIADWTIDNPADAPLLAIRLQQALDKQTQYPGVDLGSLAYRVKTAKPVEVISLIDVVERFIAASPELELEVAKIYSRHLSTN